MGTALIIGGSSGLGLELAKQLKDYKIYLTGRIDPKTKLKFIKLDLSRGNISKKIDDLLSKIKQIDLIIYSAGFLREASIDDLTAGEIIAMNNVTLMAPELIINKILKRQNELEGFIVITSTSQFTPREKQSTYTASKAGLGMFANSVSLDPRIKKTLVIAPGGMKTPFWKNNKDLDISTFLEPKWVAEKTLDFYTKQHFKYMLVKFLRNPGRIEIGESREN
jgi:short-subunit dehydrogenase